MKIICWLAMFYCARPQMAMLVSTVLSSA